MTHVGHTISTPCQRIVVTPHHIQSRASTLDRWAFRNPSDHAATRTELGTRYPGASHQLSAYPQRFSMGKKGGWQDLFRTSSMVHDTSTRRIGCLEYLLSCTVAWNTHSYAPGQSFSREPRCSDTRTTCSWPCTTDAVSRSPPFYGWPTFDHLVAYLWLAAYLQEYHADTID